MPEPSQTIRTFLALPVPPEVIAKLKAQQRELSDVLDEVSWTKPESLHLTIRFFGNVPGERLDELQKAIQETCANVPSFPVRAEKVGCFSSPRGINRSPTTDAGRTAIPRGERVIWVGVGGALQRLQELAERIRQATRGFGDHKEEREFRPHLTIGRIKKSRAGRSFVAEKLSGWAETEFGAWTVEYLELMRSELSPQGARHTCLAKIPLAGRCVAEE